jgi:hypothetical protein
MSGNSFRAKAQQCVHFSTSEFFSVGTLNPPVHASSTENEETLHQRILDARQAIRN